MPANEVDATGKDDGVDVYESVVHLLSRMRVRESGKEGTLAWVHSDGRVKVELGPGESTGWVSRHDVCCAIDGAELLRLVKLALSEDPRCVNELGPHRRTALFLAVEFCVGLPVIDELIKSGADTDVADPIKLAHAAMLSPDVFQRVSKETSRILRKVRNL